MESFGRVCYGVGSLADALWRGYLSIFESFYWLCYWGGGVELN